MAHDKLALVTGASSGIGRCLAQIAASDGHDLLLVSQTSEIEHPEALEMTGAQVETLHADLSDEEGIDKLMTALGGRCPDLLFANAGHGRVGHFADQDEVELVHLVGTNVLGTTVLVHRILRRMLGRGHGRILLTGSVAGRMPGPNQAVYNASKAYVNMLARALHHEVMGTGVSVTNLAPGPVDTPFFPRSGMDKTLMGQGPKDDPMTVAGAGYRAMMKGKAEVVSGWKGKAMQAGSHLMTDGMTAELHRVMARPRH
jgi:uncharacterized protein